MSARARDAPRDARRRGLPRGASRGARSRPRAVRRSDSSCSVARYSGRATRRDHAVREHLRVHPERRERRAELVGDRRDEPAAALAEAERGAEHAADGRDRAERGDPCRPRASSRVGDDGRVHARQVVAPARTAPGSSRASAPGRRRSGPARAGRPTKRSRVFVEEPRLELRPVAPDTLDGLLAAWPCS